MPMGQASTTMTTSIDPAAPQGPALPADGPLEPGALLSLLWLASPALPIGGFSYSEGLEPAVEAGCVHDEASAARWLVDQLHLCLARADLPVVAQAIPAWRGQDWPTLQRLDAWVRMTRESAEFRLQAEQMGRSLVEWLRSLRMHDAALAQRPEALRSPTYPLAYALALALHTPTHQAPSHGLTAYAFGWAENLVQAAIKAVPLGQGAGQRILAQLAQHIPAVVAQALRQPETERQSFSPMLAILSARHETQYSRLFRS